VENNAVNVSSWLVLSSPSTGNYKVTATPTLDSQVATWNLTVQVRLTNYVAGGHAGINVALTVVVAGASCNCSLLLWDPPTQVV